jgi:hypothetical protein
MLPTGRAPGASRFTETDDEFSREAEIELKGAFCLDNCMHGIVH